MKHNPQRTSNRKPQELSGSRLPREGLSPECPRFRPVAALVAACLAAVLSLTSPGTHRGSSAAPLGPGTEGNLSEIQARADSVAALDALLLVAGREGELAEFLRLSSEKRRQSETLAARLLTLLESQERGLVEHGPFLAPFLLEQGTSEQTLRALLPYIETVPDSVGARGFLCLVAGIMLGREGKSAQASRYFEAAARAKFPLDGHSLYLAIEAAAASRESRRMLALLESMETSHKASHLLERAHLLVGLSLLESPSEEEAVPLLERVLESGPGRVDRARVGFALGSLYEKAKRFEEAADAYAGAFRNASAAGEAGEAAGAFLSLVREGKVEGEESRLLSAAQCLLRRGRGGEAATVLEELFRNGEGSLEAGWDLGRFLYRSRRYSEAAGVYATLKRFEKRGASSRRAELWIARCERQLYHTEEAIRILRQISIASRHVVSMEAAWELGMELESLGRLEEAAESYDSLYRRFPQSSLAQEGLWRRGLCEYRRGFLGRARATFASVASDGVAASLHDSALFWMLKCSFESKQPPSSEELRHLKPSGDSLYGLLLMKVRDSETVSAEFFRTPLPAQNPALAGSPSGREDARARPEETGEQERVEPESRGPDETGNSEQAFPGGLPPQIETAVSLVRFGLRDLAREELREAQKNLRGDEARFYLAQLYWRSGFYKESLSLADRLLKNKRQLGESETRFLERMLYPIYGVTVVLEESHAQGIDPFLVLSVMRRESTFDPEATSIAGATGVMQLMPGTAGEIAAYLGEDDPSGRLVDPELNIRYGVWLLGKLKGKYSDSVVAALAAYNAGEYNAERWIERVGFQDEFLYMESISFRETREYLRRVLSDFHVYTSLYVR
ncbi:MAG: transglycosylase SLT domain-containing protein [Candidatus Eiseniibacteriota bacterium]|nr:MAG: transglycosylase SLT domain-containing protein [Candidatus Eisenbacteria bacterium]